MELHTFQYLHGKEWNVDKFPALDSEQTLILIFAAPLFFDNPEPINQLAHFYKKSKMIGCSSAGEIFGSNIFDKSLSVAVVKFAHTQIKVAKAEVHHINDSCTGGQLITQQLMQANLRSIFVLSDGLKINGSELVKGLNSAAHAGTIITGGLAGDGSDFKKTWIICDGKIHTNHVAAVGFYGEHLQVGHASKGGWDIFGPQRRITRSMGNILYELDNQPALQLYKEYLGARADELPASGLLYPLAIRNPEREEEVQLVRTILAIDEKAQSLIFAGDIPTGYYAQLMRANFDRLITSAGEAGELAKLRMNPEKKDNLSTPTLALGVSCVGRRLLLGERTDEETESTLECLSPGTQQIGFYSYGEISPFAVGNCDLHNQTMTLTIYGES